MHSVQLCFLRSLALFVLAITVPLASVPARAWAIETLIFDLSGDLEGRFLNFAPASHLDGLAAITEDCDSLRILVGNSSQSSQDDVRIVIRNLTPPLVINGAVEVSVSRMPGDAINRWEAFEDLKPLPAIQDRYLVDGDSAVVEIAGNEIGPGDALNVLVTPITPSITIAPGDYIDNEAAIQATDVGNTVVILPDTLTGLPWTEDNIQLKNGVRVTVASVNGLWPAIKGSSVSGSDTVFVFPENANSFTTLDGIEILAGDNTRVLAAVAGKGSVRNCTLRDMGENLATTGILAVDGHSGEITGCTLEMTSHAHIPGQTVIGIDLGGYYGLCDTRVSNCRINAKTGFANTYGISTSIYSDAVIESTFVKAEKHGIEMLHNSIARYCTVDSTYFEGILTEGTSQVRNCIVTNVLFANQIGIGAWDAEFCIAPDGLSPIESPTNSTEDPLYCAPGEYTLRIDSYGSPDNNGSGKQIGAYPVACTWGELVRDVALEDTALTIQGDLTVPAGRSLSLVDCPVTLLTTDQVQGGQDSSTIEIRVEGELSLECTDEEAPVCIKSASGVRGSWDGIIVCQEANASLYFLAIEDAKYGVRDAMGLTADTLKIEWCDFKNFETAGIYLKPAGHLGSVAAPLLIDHCHIYMAQAPYGIYLGPSGSPSSPFYNVLISNSIVDNTPPVAGATQGLYGIYLHGEGMGVGKDARVVDCEILRVKNGAGVSIQDFAPRLVGNRVVGCQKGIEVWNSGTPWIHSDRTVSNGIDGCVYGIHVANDAAPTVDSVYVKGSLAGTAYGVRTIDNAGGEYEDLTIDMQWSPPAPARTAIALQADSEGSPRVRSSKLERFYRGVYLGPANHIDLGVSTSDRGNNQIHATGAVSYVGSKLCIHEAPNIQARYNYWGEIPPPSGMFCSWVDYSDWLTAPPLSASPAELGFSIVAVHPQILAGPNPSRGPIRIQIHGVAPGEGAKIAIFDIQGRCVREWSFTLEEAETDVMWDGRDQGGWEVPAGVYFLHAEAGRRSLNTKLVRLAK